MFLLFMILNLFSISSFNKVFFCLFYKLVLKCLLPFY